MEKPIFTEKEAQALRKKYNPDGSLLRNQQMELLEMLKILGDICDKNDIQWWLSSGTLLGAIRHQGFVPWDDDVDIEMFREDYKKLEKILSNMQDEAYVLHSMKNDAEYVRAFDKFRQRKRRVKKSTMKDRRCGCYKWEGAGIDIFVVEKSSRFAAMLSGGIFKNLIHLTSYLKTKWLRCTLNRVIEVLCLVILNPLFRLIGLINPRGEYHYMLGMGWTQYTFFKKDILPLGKATFEGTEFPVPRDSDRHLTELYGEWYKLPTEENIKKGIHCPEFIEEIFGKSR